VKRKDTEANVRRRLSAMDCGSLFNGALQAQLQQMLSSLRPACSIDAGLIQAITCSKIRQFTGFTEEQLGQVQADPVDALNLDYASQTHAPDQTTQIS
jgi:hypothetical protein